MHRLLAGCLWLLSATAPSISAFTTLRPHAAINSRPAVPCWGGLFLQSKNARSLLCCVNQRRNSIKRRERSQEEEDSLVRTNKPSESKQAKDPVSLRDLLYNDPSEKGLLAYLGLTTVGLLALGIVAFKYGGQLQGLGFADDKYMYFDSAPSYALLLVYPPLYFLYPEARTVLTETLVLSLLATLVIWFFPYYKLGWEPNPETIFVTIAVPVVAYLGFFIWRAVKVYAEIVEEDGACGSRERGKNDR